jgi:RNA recognition motif-containing protein
MPDPIYIRGFPSSYTESDLNSYFKQFGKIKSAYIVQHRINPSFIHAIVIFNKSSSNAKAIEALHDKTLDNIHWYVAICERRHQRAHENREKLFKTKQEWMGKGIYIRNLPQGWKEDDVKQLFAEYGKIASVKITEKAVFINFDTADQATTAVKGTKGLMVDGKKIYVTLVQDRKFIAQKIRVKAIRNMRKNGPISGSNQPGQYSGSSESDFESRSENSSERNFHSTSEERKNSSGQI